MRRRWWIIAVVVVVLGGLAYVGIGIGQRISAGRQVLQSVAEQTAVVRRGTFQVTVSGSGSLAPGDEVALSLSSGGRVAEVFVDIGDTVEAGDVLARLDDTDARQAVAEAELQVTKAGLDLESAQVEAQSGLAQANLEAAKSSYEEAAAVDARSGDQLTSARVKLAQARDSLADAQDNYNTAWDTARDWELNVAYRKQALENEREATKRALTSAQYSLQVAQADYNLAAAGVSDRDVESAKAQIVSAQVTLDRQPLQVRQMELAVSQAQLKLESAQRALDETILYAPVGGTVTALNIKVGETAAAGQTAAVLSDLSTLVVEINLDETSVAQVSVGQRAIVTLGALPGVTLDGEIRAIAPVATVQSGVVLYPVTIRLGASEGTLVRAGMTADVDIILLSQEDALIAPLRAIRSSDGRSFVLRQLPPGQSGTPSADGAPSGAGLVAVGFEQVEVTLGAMTETEVQVTSGLNEGDVVSVVAAPAADSGQGPGGMFMFGRD